MEFLLEILDTDDKKALGMEEGKENWSNFNSRKPLLDSRKMFCEAGGSSSVGPAQGCWIHHYFFRVLLMILHKKDIPLLCTGFPSWSHTSPNSCSKCGAPGEARGTCVLGAATHLQLQWRGGSALLLVWLSWQSHFSSPCLPTQSLTPAQAAGPGAHVHWDMCWSTQGCSIIVCAKKLLLINQGFNYVQVSSLYPGLG